MGINGLWKVLEPLADRRSLKGFITSEALARRLNGKGLPIIGVDAGPLMYAAKGAAIRAVRHGGSWARIGRETELSCLRMHIEQWLQLPATVVVIFDGIGRPVFKRGKQVRTKEHQLASPFCEMVEASGFYHHTAPGEAEAFLATLNKAQRVDFVLTSDSDVFLFGAINVIRTPLDETNRDAVEIYRQVALLGHDPDALSPTGLVFLAALGGGDYDQDGLRGCSFQTAYKLTHSPLPQALVDILRNGDPADYDVSVYLSEWRNSLAYELASGPHLSRHFPTLAAKIPQTFPDPKVIDQYLNPFVGPPDMTYLPNWGVRFPDSAATARVAYGLLGWAPARVRTLLRQSVWVGYMIRHLLTDHVGRDGSCPRCLDSHAMPRITSITAVDGAGPLTPPLLCNVRVGISAAEMLVSAALAEADGPSEPFRTTNTTIIEIPALVVLYGMPDLLENYCHPFPLHRAHLAQCKRKIQELHRAHEAQKVHEVIDISEPTAGPSNYTITETDSGAIVIEIIDE